MLKYGTKKFKLVSFPSMVTKYTYPKIEPSLFPLYDKTEVYSTHPKVETGLLPFTVHTVPVEVFLLPILTLNLKLYDLSTKDSRFIQLTLKMKLVSLPSKIAKFPP